MNLRDWYESLKKLHPTEPILNFVPEEDDFPLELCVCSSYPLEIRNVHTFLPFQKEGEYGKTSLCDRTFDRSQK